MTTKTEVKVKVLKSQILQGNITPKELAAEVKTTPKQLRKVIRKLKLVRIGKCWQWNPKTDLAEINIIKAKYLPETA